MDEYDRRSRLAVVLLRHIDVYAALSAGPHFGEAEHNG